MRLGRLTEFRFCHSPCQSDCIGRVDAEEDDQDFRLLDSAVDPVMSNFHKRILRDVAGVF